MLRSLLVGPSRTRLLPSRASRQLFHPQSRLSFASVAADLPIAPLPTIEFSKLARRNPNEMANLLKACQNEGFFYLDLEGPESNNIETDRRSVLDFMEKYFAQPIDEKMKDDRDSETHGYKPIGKFAGAKAGQRDLYETLKVQRAEMVTNDTRLPAMVQERSALFDRFISSSQHVTQTILSCLSDVLRLDASLRLGTFHRDNESTRTALVLLSYPPNQGKEDEGIGHNKHTDIGSLTLLFSEQWGLQVLSPRNGEWEFIRPNPPHAVINVGDSLRFLTGGKLNSCVHRVVPVDGTTQEEHRYSIAYFLRPEDNARYTDSNGKEVTAKEWHDNKYLVFQQDQGQQAKDTVLTGGMEKNGALLSN